VPVFFVLFQGAAEWWRPKRDDKAAVVETRNDVETLTHAAP
jgi:hypothetical protein